jgi:hypothetical protein
MYAKIKELADEAIALQNKNRMDEVLREISQKCATSDGFELAVVGQMLTGWRGMDTRLAETYSDQTLIEQIEQMPIAGGWGLLAEMLKRFERLSVVAQQLADSAALASAPSGFVGTGLKAGEAKFTPGEFTPAKPKKGGKA